MCDFICVWCSFVYCSLRAYIERVLEICDRCLVSLCFYLFNSNRYQYIFPSTGDGGGHSLGCEQKSIEVISHDV